MNKKSNILIFGLVLATSATSLFIGANAMPLVAIDDCVGLLGSPITHAPIHDPQVEQAVDVLKSNKIQQNNNQRKPTNPETTISRARSHKDLNGVMILGGPEIVPM